MRYTLTANCTAAHAIREVESSDDELDTLFGTYRIGGKDGAAFMPALFREAHRNNQNVSHMTALGVDLDHHTDDELDDVVKRLQGEGLAFWYWETHTQSPPEDCRARIVLPFTEPFELSSVQQWRGSVWPALVKCLGVRADPACCEPSRLYYLPAKDSASLERQAFAQRGAALDVKAWAGNASKSFPRPAQAIYTPIPVDPNRPVDMEDLRKRIFAIPPNVNHFYLRRALAGECPSPPPESRPRDWRSRYDVWRSVTYELTYAVHEWEPSEAALSFLRDAYQAELEEALEGDATQWETIEGLFESARPKRAQARAEQAARNSAREKTRQEGLSALGHPSKVDPAETDDAWKAALKTKDTKEGPRVMKLASNLALFLTHARMWRDAFRLNEMTQTEEVWMSELIPSGVECAPLQATHVTKAANLFERLEDLTFSTATFREQAELRASENPYDPLVSYLSDLEWDGVERLKDLFTLYFGALAIDEEGRDMRPYLEAIGRCWAIQAAARGLSPGCKADTVLHLEGPQGAGKSTAVSILAGEWYFETPLKIGDKDSWAQCSRQWLVELPELRGAHRTNVEDFKAFITQRRDNFRKPWGRNSVNLPRRCLFVGTTNESMYLADSTGNRRHWIVKVGKIDLEALRRDRDQIWAEAAHRYSAGEQWHLTPEEETLAAAQAETRTSQDTLSEVIHDYFLSMAPERRQAKLFTTLVEITQEVLKEYKGHYAMPDVYKALKKLNMRAQQVRVAGVKRMNYYFPTDLLFAPKSVGPGAAVQSLSTQQTRVNA